MNAEQQEPASAAAVAGLARELDTVRRLVEPLPGRVDALGELAEQLARRVAALAARPSSGAMPSWLVAPADEQAVRAMLGELTVWLDEVLFRYPDAAAVVPDCWLWHPDVVEELLWLMHAWLAAYQGPNASVALVGDWHDRYRPGVVRRIKTSAGVCSVEVHTADGRRPEPRLPAEADVDQLAGWWATARRDPPPEPGTERLAATSRKRGRGR